jgi:hypothetical protein
MSYELQDPTTPRLPCPLVDNPNFKYVPASSTDIMKRFREMGWVPPSEQKGETK